MAKCAGGVPPGPPGDRRAAAASAADLAKLSPPPGHLQQGLPVVGGTAAAAAVGASPVGAGWCNLRCDGGGDELQRQVERCTSGGGRHVETEGGDRAKLL